MRRAFAILAILLGLLMAVPAFAESVLWYPTVSSYGTWAFEDMWPQRGDYDMNDLVVRYQVRMTSTGEPEAVTEVRVSLRFMARGADLNSGFGIALPVPWSHVVSSRLMVDCEDETPLGLAEEDEDQPNATFLVARNLSYSGLLPKRESYCLFSNTSPDCEEDAQDGREIVLVVELDGLQTEVLGTADVNPFSFRSTDRAREVHLANRQPTGKAAGFFGTSDDGTLSDESGRTHTYLSSDRMGFVANLPWGLDVPVEWSWPLEQVSIRTAYPTFAEWATSGGVQYPDWYEQAPVETTTWESV